MMRSLKQQRSRLILLCCLAFCCVAAAFGAPESAVEVIEELEVVEVDIAWSTVWMQLFGGLALFLLGMDIMSDAIKAVAGDGLKLFLEKMTGNRFSGAFSGALITGILNSSSVTTVLVVGFISAGLMSLTQAVSIIMGANVGSTFAAQIIAFNVTQYALLPVALGFLVRFIAKGDRARNYGDTVMGLGLIFFGMGLMGAAMTPLRDYQPFLDLMVQMNNPVMGILVGAVFTALIQSSAATTGIAIALASGGSITLEAGVALALGANIGTCVTAILAALGKSRPAVRAAVAHVLINVIGVAAWAFFIPQLCDLIRAISPAAESLTGAERLSVEVPRQIANAHTFFNVANTMVLIWFTGLLAKLCEKIVPDRPEVVKAVIQPKYLDRELLEAPSLALQRVQLEIGHVGSIIDSMFAAFKQAGWEAEAEQLNVIARQEEDIEVLTEHILKYLASMPKEAMSQKDGQQLLLLMTASNYLRSLSGMLKSELVDVVNQARTERVVPSQAMRALMSTVYRTVWEATNLCADAIAKDDPELARQVLERSGVVKQTIDQALEYQAERLSLSDPNRLVIFRVEMEFIDNMKRIYNQAKRVSKHQLKLVKEQFESS
ncbi:MULTISPECIES: Na/Pi cotransporter family protein [unclassified Lentimonas]|uniref:Na/Pi cotransporter family protein n=1 Tax=unclassified Lentimonas TaxID=2630993 RepID=UPI001326BFDA|nr:MULTISPECIES: Na/Pi cotransporter family protein [unclassified Lentimonas]CAA6678797.1 Sodium-dependent phosphate transporter [Lentimonas sp. CC4]CAA6684401.1 Sodium-dependent phosphate transporter [Lentimonas sp. CC6]CAA7077520.1 Sodium-dependent phosphate transporter [Lentimonas sp. CC4]CAA7171354.1 Sodium-dependent phosphate transporter [Lentimonas sp. CC21]CAA7183384.1 Sodium-dependent phosphate transporter [Lentimonas sp. CC8]